MYRFLEVDSAAWPGLEETAGSSPAKHHVGAVCPYVFFPLIKLTLNNLYFSGSYQ